jgi:hypothetical protein
MDRRVAWSPRAALIVGLFIASVAGAVLWFGFHQAAGAIMTTVVAVGLPLQQVNSLPSRWFYAGASGLFVAGIVLSQFVAPEWFLLVAAGCALGPTVFAVRFMYDPQAAGYEPPPDGESSEGESR